jgi:hypothetical protein
MCVHVLGTVTLQLYIKILYIVQERKKGRMDTLAITGSESIVVGVLVGCG